MKKIASLLLTTMLIASLLIGCSESATESAPSKLVNGKFEPTVTINTVRGLKDDTKFREGENIQNNVHNKWAEEKLGIKFHYLWTAPNDEQYNNKLRLALSAGEPLPDVFKVSDSMLINDLIQSGRVMPVDEAIEKYASPRLKEIFNKFPEAFYRATVDGKRYGIPRFSGGNGSDSLLWIRQDWLDKLGLEQPKTIEELEKVMDAFVKQDPDGNGKADTIGLSLASKNGLATWLADGSWIFGAYGNVVPEYWSKKEGGSIIYGSIQPSIKQALAKLNEWYEKGYLDKEVGVLDETKAVESFAAGKSGILAAPPWAEGWPIGDAIKNLPGAQVTPIPLPSGPEGKIGRKGEALITAMFLFNKDFKNMEAFFKYWDEAYAYILGGSQYFKNGLFEGYDYVMKEGKPVYDPEQIPGGRLDAGKYFLTEDVPTIPFMLYDLLDQFYSGKRKPQTAYEFNLVAKGEDYLQSGAIVNNQNQYRIENQFDGPPTKTMQKQWQFLLKMERETFAQIIYGKAPIDAFDQFVARWKSSGGDQITKEVNEWYQSVHK